MPVSHSYDWLVDALIEHNPGATVRDFTDKVFEIEYLIPLMNQTGLKRIHPGRRAAKAVNERSGKTVSARYRTMTTIGG